MKRLRRLRETLDKLRRDLERETGQEAARWSDLREELATQQARADAAEERERKVIAALGSAALRATGLLNMVTKEAFHTERCPAGTTTDEPMPVSACLHCLTQVALLGVLKVFYEAGGRTTSNFFNAFFLDRVKVPVGVPVVVVRGHPRLTDSTLPCVLCMEPHGATAAEDTVRLLETLDEILPDRDPWNPMARYGACAACEAAVKARDAEALVARIGIRSVLSVEKIRGVFALMDAPSATDGIVLKHLKMHTGRRNRAIVASSRREPKGG